MRSDAIPDAFDIRLAQAEDRASVAACVDAAYEHYIERMGTKPAPMLADYRALIARKVVWLLARESGVVGVLVMMPENDALFLENIAVHPDYQGRGLGRLLMAYVEQAAHKQGLGEIQLYTNEAMTENLAFYTRLGFIEVDRRNEDGYRRVYLRKRLNPSA